jgi:hypothetical protein
MLFKKITPGFVEQTFNDTGECVKQQFILADDGTEWETEDGDAINSMQMPLAGREFFPYEMRQPQDDYFKEG